MVARVEQWGDEQGLRLPKDMLRQADLSVGDDVEVTIQGSEIIIRKASGRKFDLAEMVARMPRNYKVHEDSFGKPEGKEEW